MDFSCARRAPQLTSTEIDFLRSTSRSARETMCSTCPAVAGTRSSSLAAATAPPPWTFPPISSPPPAPLLPIRPSSGGSPTCARLALEEAFDAAFCWGNSFGYLDRAGFAPSTPLIQPFAPAAGSWPNFPTVAESLLPGLRNRQWHKAGDIYVISDARYDARAGRLDIDYTFIRDGVVNTRPAASYVFTVSELVHQFEVRVHRAAHPRRPRQHRVRNGRAAPHPRCGKAVTGAGYRYTNADEIIPGPGAGLVGLVAAAQPLTLRRPYGLPSAIPPSGYRTNR